VANGEHPVLRVAFDDVIADRRRGERSLAAVEALLEAYDEVDVDAVYGVDATAESYRVALRRLQRAPTRDELGDLVRRLASEHYTELSRLQEFWVARIQRGDPI